MSKHVVDGGVAQHSMSITQGSTKECNGSGYSWGETAKEACQTVLRLFRRPPEPEMTKEIGGGGVEKKGEAQVDILAARGVLRPLHSSTKCVVCGLSATMEAAYKCFTCDAFGHVRCMGPGPAGTRKDERDIRCTRCARAASMDGIGISASSSNRDHSQADALIVDVMGVCLGESGRVGLISSL